jgi:hypothetical protein
VIAWLHARRALTNAARAEQADEEQDEPRGGAEVLCGRPIVCGRPFVFPPPKPCSLEYRHHEHHEHQKHLGCGKKSSTHSETSPSVTLPSVFAVWPPVTRARLAVGRAVRVGVRKVGPPGYPPTGVVLAPKPGDAEQDAVNHAPCQVPDPARAQKEVDHRHDLCRGVAGELQVRSCTRGAKEGERHAQTDRQRERESGKNLPRSGRRRWPSVATDGACDQTGPTSHATCPLLGCLVGACCSNSSSCSGSCSSCLICRSNSFRFA